MTIDYSKWIVDYDPETGVPTANINTAHNIQFSNGFYELYTSNTQAPGTMDTSPVYAVAGTETAIANSVFKMEHEYKPEENTLKITLRKQPATTANLYMSADNPYNAYGTGYGNSTARNSGGIPFNAEGVNNYINATNAYMSSEQGSDYIFPRPVTETSDLPSANSNGRQNAVMLSDNLKRTICVIRLLLLVLGGDTINPPYSYNGHQYVWYGDDNTLGSLLGGTEYIDTFFEQGYYKNASTGYTYCIEAVSVTPFHRINTSTNIQTRFAPPFAAQNVDGVFHILQPYSCSGSASIGMQGVWGYMRFARGLDTFFTSFNPSSQEYTISNAFYGGGALFGIDGNEIYGEIGWSLKLSGTLYAPCFMNEQNATFTIDTNWASTNVYKNEIHVSDSGNSRFAVTTGGTVVEFVPFYTKREIDNFISSLGMYWTTLTYTELSNLITTINTNYPDETLEQRWNRVLNSEEMYLGTILPDGTTDGTYTVGAANADGIQNEWDDISDSPVTPIDPSVAPDPDENDTGNIDLFPFPVMGTSTSFATLYGLSSAQINNMGSALWSDFVTNYKDNFMIATGTDFAISIGSIMQYFISLRMYMIDFFASSSILPIYKSSNAGVYVGTGAAGIPIGLNDAAYPYVFNSYCYYGTFGTITVPEMRYDFNDYDPHVSASLFVPFCGSTELPVSVIMGETVTLNFIIDFFNGTMQAILIKSSYGVSFPVAMMHGRCAMEIPLTGNNAAQLGVALDVMHSNNLMRTIMSATGTALTRGVLSGIGTAATSLMTGAIDEINAAETTNLTVQTLSTAGDFTAMQQPSRAYIQLRRRNPVKPSTYGRNTGNMLNASAALGSLSGFTVCKNPDLSGISGATASELREIYNALTTGVYL